jgi:hypothetical protein
MMHAAELLIIFCFVRGIKPNGLYRLQTKNAAKSGIICLVTPAGFKPTTFRTGI